VCIGLFRVYIRLKMPKSPLATCVCVCIWYVYQNRALLSVYKALLSVYRAKTRKSPLATCVCVCVWRV